MNESTDNRNPNPTDPLPEKLAALIEATPALDLSDTYRKLPPETRRALVPLALYGFTPKHDILRALLGADPETIGILHQTQDAIDAMIELPTTGPDTQAPRLARLGAFRDAPQPDPVLWRDADGKGGAVLSVGEVALLSGEGGQGKSYLTLALAVKGALAADLGQPYGAACGLRMAAGPSVLVSYEDSPARVYGRLASLGQTAAQDALHVVEYPAPLWETDRGRGLQAGRLVGRPVALR